MTVNIHFTHPYRGGVFHWNMKRLDGVRSFRFGPILIKVRK